jgi:transcriptional regulator with XRE-family HTH domain
MTTRGRKTKVRPTPIESNQHEDAARRKAVGARLRELRTKREWSFHDLAARANVTATEIRRVEAGTVDPKTGTLLKLAKALDCSDQWLILGID